MGAAVIDGAVGDSVGTGVGLYARSKHPHALMMSQTVPRAPMGADGPSHLGVGAVGGVDGGRFGAAVGATVASQNRSVQTVRDPIWPIYQDYPSYLSLLSILPLLYTTTVRDRSIGRYMDALMDTYIHTDGWLDR